MNEKYEISLWEDYEVAAANGVAAHYEERKLCIIGSNAMTSENRAYDAKLVENINGTNTFTFRMYYYLMDDKGKKYQNPFLNLLVNERKVKVLWRNKWYDFIIKNCQEDSSGKSITYTCQDLFINELSKTGFDLEFDSELMNNQGTVTELAERVLEGTDWQLGVSDTIQQLQEEPTYSVITERSVNSTINQTKGSTGQVIPANKTILLFYQSIYNIMSSDETSGNVNLQFAYAESYETDINSQLVINADCYLMESLIWEKETIGSYDYIVFYKQGYKSLGPWFKLSLTQDVSQYRAKKLVESQIQIFDPLTNQYVKVYKANSKGTGFSTGDEIYSYDQTEYSDPIFVNNLIVNGKNFSDFTGWGANNSTSNAGFKFQLSPKITEQTVLSNYSAISYLKMVAPNGGAYFYNAALQQQTQFLPNGIAVGDKFCFRIKLRQNGTDGPSDTYASDPSYYAANIYSYSISNSIYTPDTTEALFTSNGGIYSENWLEYELTCQKPLTRAKLLEKNIGLFFRIKTNYTRWAEEIEFFSLKYDNQGERINPGDYHKQSVAAVYHKFYNHSKSGSLLKAEDVQYIYNGTIDWNLVPGTIVPQKNENFEKIRSIQIKNSNRFNILQELAQTFECWVRFSINHDPSTGRTIYTNGVPQKRVSFVSQIGQQTGLKFVYGLDLKQIQRTIQSNQIATKTIVKSNNNEFAQNGFCTIARSTENYPRTNFIFNFDYYISQGLLNGGKLNKDLYDNENGYYTKLHRYNIEYDNLSELISQLELEIIHQESAKNTYIGQQSAINTEILNLQSEIQNKAGASTLNAAKSYLQKNTNDNYVSQRVAAWQNNKQVLSSLEAAINNINTSLEQLNTRLDTVKDAQDEIIEQLKEEEVKFYKKYSRFIQEGSWTSEKYIDDNLYYLDALGVAYTSSRPQVQYNISVIRLNSITEFKNRQFFLGDIAAIQDIEFFGYKSDGITPYAEKVLVAEITYNFDSPSQDSFKIQNYKTQFEDLFQRITATTQSLQYSSGEYARAAAIIEPNGTIKAEVLQSSIALNSEFVVNAQNEMVVTDNTGVTVRDATNPNAITKLTSGGIFISIDGGETWKNAVRGEGVATQYLTAGSINVNQINLMNGAHTAFRWDSTGINAYDTTTDTEGQSISINLSKFVRFDHYGVYGLNNNSGGLFNPDISQDQLVGEDLIWEKAQFGLTWRGFFLNNDDNSVRISSDNDFEVIDDSDKMRIKIGRLSGSSGAYRYGIQINNGDGDSVLETNDEGELWLRKRLNISSTAGSDYLIGLGYLNGVKAPGSSVHEVFNANNKFTVYEDGSMKATDGEFTGTIYATGGKIGNMTIGEVEQSVYKVIIESNSGTIFKNGQGTKLLTAKLYQGDHEVTTGTFTYVWFKNGTQQAQTTKQISVTADATDAVYTYTCRITYTSES